MDNFAKMKNIEKNRENWGKLQFRKLTNWKNQEQNRTLEAR